MQLKQIQIFSIHNILTLVLINVKKPIILVNQTPCHLIISVKIKIVQIVYKY